VARNSEGDGRFRGSLDRRGRRTSGGKKAKTAGGGSVEHVLRLTPAEITWTVGPPMLPPGASMAVIEGAFSKPGPFTVRLKFPANYRIPPHWHPVKVTVTVISGTFNMGFGDRAEYGKGQDAAGRQHLRDAGEDSPLWLDY